MDFDKTQQIIGNFINSHSINPIATNISSNNLSRNLQKKQKEPLEQANINYDSSYKLQVSDALFCAGEEKRNKLFFEAIQLAITKLSKTKQRITVYDAGSGIGVLGIFALLSGADKVIFMEHNPYSLSLNKKLVGIFGFNDKSEFIECNATSYTPIEKFDLLISETITSGFVDEDFPLIINNLKKYGNKGSIIIPESFAITVNPSTQSSNHSQEILCANTKSSIGLTPITLNIKSKDGFKRQSFKIGNSDTVEFTMNVTLFGCIKVNSGDCMSFINPRIFNIKDRHQLFDFLL